MDFGWVDVCTNLYLIWHMILAVQVNVDLYSLLFVATGWWIRYFVSTVAGGYMWRKTIDVYLSECLCVCMGYLGSSAIAEMSLMDP